MLNINEDDLKRDIVHRAADQLVDDEHLSGLVAKEVKARVDKLFIDRAEAQISAAIDEAIKGGFEREYQRVNAWGQAEGDKTSIKKKLDELVSGYWNAGVDKYGKPATGGYDRAMTRAEWLMTQVCAKDFSDAMKESAINMTGALKDGMRNQMAKFMDDLLGSLFHVKSLQDQGKVEKPY